MKTLLVIAMAAFHLSCGKGKTAQTAGDELVQYSSGAETAGRTKVLTQGLQFPWEILWGPDNQIWMTERTGLISRVNPADGQVTPLFSLIDVVNQGDGGLHGMVLHPDFQQTPEVFLAYSYLRGTVYTEKVVRYRFNGNTLTDPKILIDRIPAGSTHNGGRMLISPDGKLFVSTGDATNPSRVQVAGSLSGKILRINLDGTIPLDNPDPKSPVWSTGHRNPQGMVFVNGRLLSSEHGPTTDDEINIIEKGRNYGWPNVTGKCDNPDEKAFCQTNDVKEPIYTWTPCLAVSGMDYYDNQRIPSLNNSLILACLRATELLQLKLNSDGTNIVQVIQILPSTYGRLRDVCISPDGKIYVCTSNGENDKIISIE